LTFLGCNLDCFFGYVTLKYFQLRRTLYITGVANQSETKSHISYCVTAKSHIIHMDTHEHNPISSSLTHIPLLSEFYCKYQ